MKVFLGGTCNESKWRDELIPMLETNYFNPVVDDWTIENQVIEFKQKKICKIHLYVISKEMTGVYSIAEAVNSSNKNYHGTVFCVLRDGFDEGQLRSLKAVEEIITINGSYVCNSLKDAADYINEINKYRIL